MYERDGSARELSENLHRLPLELQRLAHKLLLGLRQLLHRLGQKLQGARDCLQQDVGGVLFLKTQRCTVQNAVPRALQGLTRRWKHGQRCGRRSGRRLSLFLDAVVSLVILCWFWSPSGRRRLISLVIVRISKFRFGILIKEEEKKSLSVFSYFVNMLRKFFLFLTTYRPLQAPHTAHQRQIVKCTLQHSKHLKCVF